MIIIDDMKYEDVSGVCLVEEECFSQPWSYNAFLAELENEQAVTLVAIEDKEIIGFVNVHFLLGEGNINNIAVTKKARNKGTANALLKAVLERAHKEGVVKLNLEVRESNSGAAALYQKNGFCVVGKRKGFYEQPHEDAILMTLTL